MDTNMMKRAYAWVKEKILWFFLGGVALAAGVAFIPVDCSVEDDIAGEISYFAYVVDGTVEQVIVADKGFICSGYAGDTSKWFRTSEKGTVRMNYASRGDNYDTELDAFVAKKPRADATLDPQTAKWVVPAKTETVEEQSFFVASSTEI